MAAMPINEGIVWVGAIDWDRRLFDELIPLPDGTSYNAYIVRGADKTALIDTVDPTKTGELLEPVLAKGAPTEKDFQALDNLAAAIAAKHRGLGVLS